MVMSFDIVGNAEFDVRKGMRRVTVFDVLTMRNENIVFAARCRYREMAVCSEPIYVPLFW